MKIYNPTSKTLAPSTQLEIRKAMANAGVDTVHAVNSAPHEDSSIFDLYADELESIYLFSIDTDGDVIFEKQ